MYGYEKSLLLMEFSAFRILSVCFSDVDSMSFCHW